MLPSIMSTCHECHLGIFRWPFRLLETLQEHGYGLPFHYEARVRHRSKNVTGVIPTIPAVSPRSMDVGWGDQVL